MLGPPGGTGPVRSTRRRAGAVLLLPGAVWMGILPVWSAQPVRLDTAGIVVEAEGAEKHPSRITLERVGRFLVRMHVARTDGPEAVTVRVALAATGPKTWPAEDLCVTDNRGIPAPIRRNGTEWHRFTLEVPAAGGDYLIQAVPATRTPPGTPPAEKERTAVDSETGVRASVCTWFGGREAALCLRFDDSHPTHLDTVLPILREHGYRATFMINPGRPAFQQRKAAWEACARTGEHEFANHTMNHRGARTDEEIEHEVGEPAAYIRKLFPRRGPLIALNRGGGTTWVTRRPFSHFLDKHDLFNVWGSMGMDDVYGKRLEALERHLLNGLARNGWIKAHFHAIGPALATSEEHFRAQMRLIEIYADRLWITGLADAYKYRQERKSTAIAWTRRDGDCLILEVRCATDPVRYDQPLTIQIALPPDWDRAKLVPSDAAPGTGSETQCETERGEGWMRANLPPLTRRYLLHRTGNAQALE